MPDGGYHPTQPIQPLINVHVHVGTVFGPLGAQVVVAVGKLFHLDILFQVEQLVLLLLEFE